MLLLPFESNARRPLKAGDVGLLTQVVLGLFVFGYLAFYMPKRHIYTLAVFICVHLFIFVPSVEFRVRLCVIFLLLFTFRPLVI